jgi:hypothetical protein
MIDLKRLQELRENWEPPRELMRGTPREVHVAGAGVFFRILIASCLLGGLAAVTILLREAQRDAARERRFDENTSVTDARILQLRRRRGDEPRCSVTYSFVAGGLEYSRSARIPCREWDKLAQGSRLPVKFVLSDPAISRLAGLERARVTPYWVGPVIALGLVAAAFFLARFLASRRRLLEEGRPAPAIVTRHSSSRSQHGEVFYACYEFSTLSGARGHGKYSVSSKKKLPPIGSTLTVVYDRDHPRRNARYPMSLYKLSM